MFTKLIENIVPVEMCDELIDFSKKLNLDFVSTYNYKTNKEFLDTSFNKRKGVRFETSDFSQIQSFSENIFNILNELKLYDGIVYNNIPSFLFNSYEETHFLNYHADNREIEDGATITVLLQLNDNYEGGEFCYKLNNIVYEVPKIKGSVFLFESHIQHKVNIVKKGTRYSLNAWPHFTKLKTSKLF